MNCLSLCLPLLHLVLLLDSVHTSIPSPVNVTVDSVNFHHVLHWDPGPGTPVGTLYNVYSRESGRKNEPIQHSTKSTSSKLKLKHNRTYILSVQASYNQTLSPVSHRITFTPYSQTKLGPPKLSVAGCGKCIQVNISLPEPVGDILAFSRADVLLREELGDKLRVFSQETSTFTLSNLESGVRYCVQVHLKFNVNPHSEPSAWECAMTSPVEPRRGPVVLGALAVVLICLFITVAIGSCGLYYTGFLCKLKAAVPRGLLMALNQGYTMTPQKMILDQISIDSVSEKEKKHSNSLQLVSGELEDEDEDENNEINVYLERDAEIFRGSQPLQDSGYVSSNSKATMMGASEKLTVKLSAKVEALHIEFKQEAAKAEEAEFSFMHKMDQQPDVQDQDMFEKEVERQAISSNVNLFSVKLSALAEGDEDEKELEPSYPSYLWARGDLDKSITGQHKDNHSH